MRFPQRRFEGFRVYIINISGSKIIIFDTGVHNDMTCETCEALLADYKNAVRSFKHTVARTGRGKTTGSSVTDGGAKKLHSVRRSARMPAMRC